MAETPLTSSPDKTLLNPPMDGQEPSSDPSHQSSDPAQPPEKRKRDEEGDAQQEQHPLWKTSLCSYFRRTGGLCSHGDSCRYAHGESELRPRPDNTWDPTSERAKKVAKKDTNGRDEVEEMNQSGIMMTEVVNDVDGCGGLDKCLVNLPMRWTSDKLRSFLDEHTILFKSAKKKKGMVVGFVSFENAEQVKRAMEELVGISFGNKNLKIADVIPRSFEKKTKGPVLPCNSNEPEESLTSHDNLNGSDSEGDGTTDDVITPNSSVLKDRSARSAVTPLAHLPYADQLEQKKSSLMQTLKRLTRNARKACPNGVSLPEWILKSREIGGLPCNFEGIIESPLIDGYRNKCEFSIGYSLQGKPTVGFLLGNFREGVTAVEEPIDCPNVSKIACKYAAIFQEFLRNSDLPIWNRLNNTGFWRQLTVREGRAPRRNAEVENSGADIAEVMLMVQVSTSGFGDEEVDKDFQRMAQAFVVGAAAESPHLPLTVLVVQDHRGISNAAPADAPLRSLPILKVETNTDLEAGSEAVEPRIHDYISNLQFSLSPTAFFQVNTLAAEKLYSLAGEWARLGPDTLLFDVCCGTGTIGLTLAHRVGMVVGIEMNASAVSDAQRNADINGVKNCRFVCGKAEDIMGSLLKEYLSSPLKDNTVSDEMGKFDKEFTSGDAKVSSADNTEAPEVNSNMEHENGESEMNCTSGNAATPRQQFTNVVAIVDPPRVGLHPTVIKVLRTHSQLRRLVYISCNPESLVANAIELCTPCPEKSEKGNNKNNRGWRNMSSAGLARHRAKSMPNSEPYSPVKAMAVDLFPHTPHCELVMLLER